MTYNPSYDIKRFNFKADLAFGEEGEELIRQFVQTICDGDIEVKTDRYRNGRMVIETMQSPHNKGWKPSGLSVTKARWWVYVFNIEGSFVIVDVDRLKRFIDKQPKRFAPSKLRSFAVHSDNPAKGWLLEAPEVIDLLVNPDYD